ncbi:T9SS C-terminal target domain-containing protein [Sphingobacteriales bacterium UPWRP_1]|nr:hypothetical protein B6N25_06175 [Sphingobacteriales bacterium TSM_CSS]PSJ78659.1 T9SS C-terminal target domain-containing protein [Sphingobacteriales bacterium UPWRP_1]
MYKKLRTVCTVFALMLAGYGLQAEGTLDRISTSVFQTQCATAGCHAGSSPAAGLNLQTTGNTLRNSLYNVNSSNAVSQAAGNRVVFPGHPYRSKLFLLVNNGLAADAVLLPDEDPGNIHASLNLSNLDKELIRQWILFDSPVSGEAVSHGMLETFYSGNGIWATDPAAPPAKPAPGEGFQIHLGPIFLPPWEGADQPDEEYHYKYATLLPENIEITRLEGNIGSSHHMILYRYNNTANAATLPYGLQQTGMTGGRSMVAAFGQTSTVDLPGGTAFKWYEGSFIDVNTHVVNYSPTAVLATDVFINVYTQPFGTAAQEMKTTLLINPAIFIIYNNGEQAFTDDVRNVAGLPSTYYVWEMSSHTHRHGQSFNVWRRNSDGTKGEHLYNANKYNGIPECEEIGYDYQHPPARTFEGYLPVVNSEGLIQEATFINNDVQPWITWGETVNDEMMITGIFYLDNLNGVEPPNPSVCFADELNTGIAINPNASPMQMSAAIIPNPAQGIAQLHLASPRQTVANFVLTDLAGRELLQINHIQLQPQQPEARFLDLTGLPAGMYLYRLTGTEGIGATGKLLVK